MVNTTNLNMGVVMNQINPEVIRVSTEYILYSFDFKQQNQDIWWARKGETILYNNKIFRKLASKKFLYIGI